MSNKRLQATVCGGLLADRNRPRSPTAPEAHRSAGMVHCSGGVGGIV